MTFAMCIIGCCCAASPSTSGGGTVTSRAVASRISASLLPKRPLPPKIPLSPGSIPGMSHPVCFPFPQFPVVVLW